MSVCGIIAEYNPFHAGHAYHSRRIRAQLPDAVLVSVMSGNYVQRGDLAVWEKYRRAGYAVRAGGPDLIFELSLPAALGSAERFAAGAVSQLLSTGCLTHLSFGSECGDAALLRRTAAVMLGSTETTFYTIAVYFGAAGIKKTRYAVPAALCADIAGFLAAALTTRLLLA